MFGFATSEAAPAQSSVVNQPFEDKKEVEVVDPEQSKLKAQPVETPTQPAETPTQPVEAPTQPVETPTEAKPTEQPADKPVDTSNVDTTAPNAPTVEKSEPVPEPYRSQVDTVILDYMKQFEGKTIVDIEFEGASEATLPTVKVAVTEHVGDTFSAAAALRDRNALVNTGYFYEAYQTFEEIPEGIVITFHVLENPILKDIVYTGNTLYTKEELDHIVTLKKGEILNSNTLHDNISAIQEDYRNEGFILMKVTDMNIDKEGVLTLRINEGILEGYAVKGNKKTKDKVILREMRQEVGTPFNAKLARRSMQRVYNLGFFEDVNLKMNPGVEPNAVIMEVNVKEKRTGTFGIGAGYSTSDGIIGMVSVTDTNFRGVGDTISVMYERSGNENDAHGYSFTYRHPWMDRHETAIRLQIYNRTYAYNDYDTRGHFKEEYMRKYVGGEITISRPVSEYSTNFITFRNRKDRYVRHVSSGNMGDRSTEAFSDWRKKNFGLTRSITLEHVTDTRDNIYEPTTGNKVNLALEVGNFGGDFNFQKVSIEHQHYRVAGDHNQVWAFRGMYGYGRGDLTEFNQFRLGGQGSLRGYRDDQFRGNRLILGSIEYRFPLYKKVQGALFTDFGGVWDTGLRPRNLKGSYGIGVAMNTPMGPMRLDYGRGSQGGRFHFTVGTSF
ncbi:MAG: BamA/TamA family outer membrane protein [Quinella sp. 3Q1]|nr:BamA/TamA family outer membrane protein [Quinella sp. 3Q1]MBR6887783.1 BamA/TamA family outer membrane protein [Selenomonadaceae bacterium]